ncbi:MAG: phosphoadenylyl-sulfate reductase [Chloroflexi bacterium OHK40]
MVMLSEKLAAWSSEELEALNERFRERPPEELLAWAADTFAGRAVLTCSFGGAAGMVLLDIVARQRLPIAVVFLDTDLLFPETYALAREAARHYDIAIEWRRPALTPDEQERQYGPQLYARDPDRCCGIRKVAPLAAALRPYQAWVSGIRRDQTAQRAATEPVQWSAKHGLLKLSPLAYWTERQVWAYIHANGVPYNPLLDRGYPSLGCVPCTRAASADNPRGGRWAGTGKTECGIHL